MTSKTSGPTQAQLKNRISIRWKNTTPPVLQDYGYIVTTSKTQYEASVSDVVKLTNKFIINWN